MKNFTFFVLVLFSAKLYGQCTPAVTITIFSPITGTSPCPNTYYNVYATPNNIGPYQWTLNGVVSSTTDYVSPYNGNTLVQGDVITCAPVSNLSCKAIYTVNYIRPHYLTMSASPSANIQAGTSVTFTGDLNISSGTALLYTYAFYVNDVKVYTSYTNAATYMFTTNTLANGDVVYSTVQRNPMSNPCGSLDTSNSVAISVSAILPISLVQFNVNGNGNQFSLNWSTASEINSAYFNVQTSSDGSNFTTVGQVAASGNSSLQNQYNFSFQPTAGSNTSIYFRLQMVDKDGSVSYSSIQKASLNSRLNVVVSPNPATSSIHVNGTNMKLLQLLDMSGKILFQQNVLQNNNLIDISSFSRGIYLLHIEDSDGNGQVQKIVFH